MPFFRAASRPRVFAHRGGCALGPENTMAAFDLGITSGADGLELDVHLAADGVVVVCHDATLDRTTDASGPIAARTTAELRGVDAGYRYTDPTGQHPFRGRGVTVPTLREVLQRYPTVPMIIEMKPDTVEIAHAVAADVRTLGAVDRVCIAGYGSRSLSAARTALPEVATSAGRTEVRLALYRSWAGWPVTRTRYAGYQVPERAGATRIASPQFIRHAHSSGLEVQVWTVDDEVDMVRLLEWGADGLISNRPDLAVRVRDRFVSAGQSVPVSPR